MIRYRYSGVVQPPAPFVNVTLRRVDGRGQLDQQPAQLDTGSDRTIIPPVVVETLSLVPLDRIQVAGFGGVVHEVTSYLLELGIHALPPRRVEVLAHNREPWVILGRDVLNQFRIVLDGPGLALEIE
jgi:hypothetical protein